MKRKVLLFVLLLYSICMVWSQTTPPEGTKFITMRVQPNKEFKFGLIAKVGSRTAWIKLGDGAIIPLTIGESLTVPTVFSYSSPSETVKLYGSFHIFGCPGNGACITLLDATGYSPLEQLYCNNNAITQFRVKGCERLSLLNCSSNRIQSLDLSDCKELKELACYDNLLRTLDLSQNKDLLKIHCPQNALVELDLTHNTKLQEVQVGKNKLKKILFPSLSAIRLLYAYENQLKSIDAKKIPLLEDLDIYDNQLEALDLTACDKLESVDCSENKIKTLDITASKGVITTLSCADNEITHLNVTDCSSLNYLNASNNQLKMLSLDGVTKLEKLYLYSNQLSKLDIASCSLLKVLMINTNKMSACGLDDLFNALPRPITQGNLQIVDNVGAPTSTTSIAVQKNWKVDVQGDGSGCGSAVVESPPPGMPMIKLTTKPGSSITVTMRVYAPDSYVWIESSPGVYTKELISSDYDHPSVFTIPCPGNEVKLHSKVVDFSCSKNGEAITAIDASNNPELATLYCHENAITDLKINGCTYLADLSCGKNKIKTLDLTNLNYLQYLFCYENQIEVLDISHCKMIEELECSSNDIAVLDLSNLSRATTIMCHTNKIATLNLANCKKLREFNCANNQLTELNLEACESLVGLSCGSNQLTRLDVSKCSKLNRLFCSVNPKLLSMAWMPDSELQQFSAMECGFTMMEIPQSPKLTKVLLSKNPLTALSLGRAPQLNHLAVDECKIAIPQMDQLFDALPRETEGQLKIAGNPNVETSRTEVAVKKGWTLDIQGGGSTDCLGIVGKEGYRLVVTHDAIVLTTANASKVVVWDLLGNRVSDFISIPRESKMIALPSKGTYLVTIDGHAEKVLVK